MTKKERDQIIQDANDALDNLPDANEGLVVDMSTIEEIAWDVED